MSEDNVFAIARANDVRGAREVHLLRLASDERRVQRRNRGRDIENRIAWHNTSFLRAVIYAC